MTASSLHPINAHYDGITKLAYTPDARYLFTVGTDSCICRFEIDEPKEPTKIDTAEESFSISVSRKGDLMATCGNDGGVRLYATADQELKHMVTKFSHTALDAKFSPDGDWLAACGTDSDVRIVNLDELTNIITIKHPNYVKQLSYHDNSGTLATSSVDGTVRFYSMSSTTPNLVHTIDNICPALKDPELPTSLKVAWHPDGQVFALPTTQFDVNIYAWGNNWDRCATLATKSDRHKVALTDIEWSPNGRYLATCAADNKVVIWDCAGNCVCVHDVQQPIALAWRPTHNMLSVTTERGQLLNISPAVPLDKPICYGRTNEFAKLISGQDEPGGKNEERSHTDDELDDIGVDNIDEDLDDDDEDEVARSPGLSQPMGIDNWIEDDDNAGYVDAHNPRGGFSNEARNEVTRRLHVNGDHDDDRRFKRPRYENGPGIQHVTAFQSGSTPWKNDRRYLCMNDLGYVWTVRQESHNTVTVTFFDEDIREYHFTDYDKFDLASMTSEAVLFANSRTGKVMLRYHDTMKEGWQRNLHSKSKDRVRCIALSDRLAVVCTEHGFIQTHGLYGGMPINVSCSHTPVLNCAIYQDLAMLIYKSANGGLLTYSLQNLRTGYLYQKNDHVDICSHADIQGTFFSDEGDPYVVDTSGVVFVLSHWRRSLQTRWIPLFRPPYTEQKRTHWPLGVSNKQYRFILLPGATKTPTMPLPMHMEQPLCVPTVSNYDRDEEENEDTKFEQKSLTDKVLVGLLENRLVNDDIDEETRNDLEYDLSRSKVDADKDAVRTIYRWIKAESGLARVVDVVQQLNLKKSIETARSVASSQGQLQLVQAIDKAIQDRLERELEEDED